MRPVLLPSIALMVAVMAGCARQAAPPARPRASRPRAVASLDEAKRTVVKYVKSLESGDYAAAHALLTADSRKKHPLEEFREQAEQGMATYDLGRCFVKQGAGGRAVVTVPLVEDPAMHNFVLVREHDQWRIAYDGGRPWAPYAA